MNLFDQLSIFKHINGIIYKHSQLSKNTEKKKLNLRNSKVSKERKINITYLKLPSNLTVCFAWLVKHLPLCLVH